MRTASHPRAISFHQLLIIVCLLSCGILVSGKVHAPGHYTNDWVVRVTGGANSADQLAGEHGYQNMGELMGFPDTYLMRSNNHPRRSKRDADHLTKRLSDDHRVVWAEQQVILKREKRGIMGKRRLPPPGDKEMNRFNDELWSNEWYLHDTRDMADLPQLDMKVIPVWDLGYTGKGICVTILDDGVEGNHTDLKKNYEPKASWDTNDNDPDPFPRYESTDSNNHGTRCAGEVAMQANNQKCGVGVAYDVKIGGVRMLDGDVSDGTEAVSLAFGLDTIDVFSSSWGPCDDGRTLDGPKRLAQEALIKGVTKGRKGKGVIYVWASGNGGGSGDNCNCDGYTSSIYTLSIGSASQQGRFPWYGEQCASTLATTFSSGAYKDQKISTTDLHNACTSDHTGTSAAAPLAAGVVALVLQANPNLNWRDMQHLVAWTSDYKPLQKNHGWRRNAAGLMYNNRFGFGLMNAHALVLAALKWTSVTELKTCHTFTKSKLPAIVTSGNAHKFFFEANGCKGTTNQVDYIENAQITLDMEYPNRGVLEIYLIAPSGTSSMLLSRREQDDSELGFKMWTFTSVHFWGEPPKGTWTLLIRDMQGQGLKGTVKAVKLTHYGTDQLPAHMKKGKRVYEDEKDAEDTIDITSEVDDDHTSSESMSDSHSDSSYAKEISARLNDWGEEPLKDRDDLSLNDLIEMKLRNVDQSLRSDESLIENNEPKLEDTNILDSLSLDSLSCENDV